LYSVPMALDRLTKLSLNETYTKDRIGKHLCDVFAIQNGLKQGHALSPLLFNFASEYALKKKNTTAFFLTDHSLSSSRRGCAARGSEGLARTPC